MLLPDDGENHIDVIMKEFVLARHKPDCEDIARRGRDLRA